MNSPSETLVEARRRAVEWSRISSLSGEQRRSAEEAEQKRAEAWSSGHRDHGQAHDDGSSITGSSMNTPSDCEVGSRHGFSMALDSTAGPHISHDSDSDIETDDHNY
jgi:hypothetical protein